MSRGILPAADAAELADCERVIERGLQTFVEVGTALAAIRDRRLYRASHDTFEAYCDDRWNISRPRAYELIGAASVVSAMADTGLPLPANERQARELTSLPPDQLEEVWRQTLYDTDGKPTAAAIREAKEVFRHVFAEANERRQLDRERSQQQINERMKLEREEVERTGRAVHRQEDITLGAMLEALADGVVRSHPVLVRDGQRDTHSAWSFGYIDWHRISELETHHPTSDLGKAKSELLAAIADYEAELTAAVKRAKAATQRIAASLRKAAAAADVVVATRHSYSQPWSTGFLVTGHTDWHDEAAS